MAPRSTILCAPAQSQIRPRAFLITADAPSHGIAQPGVRGAAPAHQTPIAPALWFANAVMARSQPAKQAALNLSRPQAKPKLSIPAALTTGRQRLGRTQVHRARQMKRRHVMSRARALMAAPWLIVTAPPQNGLKAAQSLTIQPAHSLGIQPTGRHGAIPALQAPRARDL